MVQEAYIDPEEQVRQCEEEAVPRYDVQEKQCHSNKRHRITKLWVLNKKAVKFLPGFLHL